MSFSSGPAQQTKETPQQQATEQDYDWEEEHQHQDVLAREHSPPLNQASSNELNQAGPAEPTLGQIDFYSYSPDILQPFMGLRDVNRDDDPWNRPHAYRDGNLYVYSDGRHRIRRDAFGQTRKMYLYEIGTTPSQKAYLQWSSRLRDPFVWFPPGGNQLIMPLVAPWFRDAKITIKPPVVVDGV